jgi:hypothetical protein
MTSGPDSLYIEHSRAISLASWHTRVERPPPLLALAILPNHLGQLAGTWFCNHSRAPVSPPVSYQVTHRRTLSAIDGAPSHIIIGPFMFRPYGGAEAEA